MPFQIPEELIRTGTERFARYGEELQLRLKLHGVPLCEVDPTELDSELWSPAGLCLLQYRSCKNGWFKTKWLTDCVPKHANADRFCEWNLLPVHIVPRKRGDPHQGLTFHYLLQEIWITSGGTCGNRLSLIAADEKGVPRKRYVEHQTSRDKPPFAFPRQYISRINRVLANDFLVRYWGGEAVPAWQFTREGIAYYLGCLKVDDREDAWDGVQQLLDSDAGDTAAILTAYTAFGVLKHFFPHFHRLDTSSPYLDVKKYLPQQFALSLCCEDPEKASQLVQVCCCINPDIPLDGPIEDGVRIRYAPPQKQGREITLSEYEATVIQKASVLWVGRRPSEKVLQTGCFLPLELPVSAAFPDQSVLPPVLARLTARIHARSVADFQKFCTEVVSQAKPIIRQLLSEIRRAEDRHSRYLEEGILEHWEQNFQTRDTQYDLLRIVQSLKDMIDLDLYDLRRDAIPSVCEQIDLLQEECDELFQHTTSEIKKVIGKCRKKRYNLCSQYQTAYTFLEKCEALPPGMRSHLAYLLASYGVLLRFCAPEEQQMQRLAQLERALVHACGHRAGLPAGEILERYLSRIFAAGRCARLRGQGSGGVEVCLWYDPREHTLLLPSKTYFDQLCSLIPGEAPCTKRLWETRMEQAGLLKTVSRKGQLRRTFEVCTREKDAGKVSVLKVPLDALSQHFLQTETVQQALARMDADPTPYRSVSILIEK